MWMRAGEHLRLSGRSDAATLVVAGHGPLGRATRERLALSGVTDDPQPGPVDELTTTWNEVTDPSALKAAADAVLADRPDSERAHFLRATATAALVESGAVAPEDHELESAATRERFPHAAWPAAVLGDALRRKGDEVGAAQAYAEASSKPGDDGDAARETARSYLRIGKPVEAAHHARRSLRLSPADSETLVLLAEAADLAGDSSGGAAARWLAALL